MASVCVGCGLVVEEDGSLSLGSQPERKWPFDCDISDGMGIWCDPETDLLHSLPDHCQVSGFRSVPGLDEQGLTPITVAPGDTYCSDMQQMTINNPFCRPLNLHIQYGIRLGMVMEPGSTPQLGYRRNIGRGVEGPIVYERFPGLPANAGQNVAAGHENERDFFDIIIPAGGSRTFGAGVCLVNGITQDEQNLGVPPPTGNVYITQGGASIRFWGGTTMGYGPVADGILV